MARPRRKTRNRTTVQKPGVSPLVWVGAGVAGLLGLLLWKSSADAAAASLDVSSTTGLPPGVTGTTPRPSNPGTESYSYSGPMIPAAVARRLSTGGRNAQIAFAVQALLYSARVTDQSPDALGVTVNQQLAALAARGAPVGTSLTEASLGLVRQYLFGRNPGLVLRTLPWQMPQLLIDQVNAASQSVDSQFIYLQAMPAMASTSAGQVLLPAG